MINYRGRAPAAIFFSSLVLAACNGASTMPSSVQSVAVPPTGSVSQTVTIVPAASRLRIFELQRQISGSAFFIANYKGRYRLEGLGCGIGRHMHFKFHGTGNARFLNESKEQGVLKAGGSPTGRCYWSGDATLSSSTNPDDSIFMQLSIENYACLYGGTFQVSGGTGKFVNATGSGTLTLQCSGNKYVDQWSGTLYY